MNRRDFSISMARANVVVMFISIPVVIVQFAIFIMVQGMAKLDPTWNSVILIFVVLLGVAVHELIHGITWAIFGRKQFSAIKFGIQWKTLTPYAHLKGPVEVNAYRMGAFMPGFILGILTYILSVLLGNGNLFWFSLVHTAASGGDWLILWLIRNVNRGMQVEDHPTNAGCHVIGSESL
jgi:NADH:ubiquinone oxidoreductase subunit K